MARGRFIRQPDFGRAGWTQAVQGAISIYEPFGGCYLDSGMKKEGK